MNDLQVQMDAASIEATKELQKNWTAQLLVDWLRKWYLKAGYKRLCRALFAFYPKDTGLTG